MYFGRLVALLGVTCALVAQPPLTTIQDTIYKADGTRFNGTATITWKTFNASDTSDIAMQSATTRIVEGSLYIQLVPNTNATPVNYYNVFYASDGREQFRERWAVPPSAVPLRVRDVRVANSGTGTGTGTGTTGTGTTGTGTTGTGTTGTGTGAGGVATGGTVSSLAESQVVGLGNDLQIRPVQGPGYAPGRSAWINSSGQLEAVAGNVGDCVHVDGTTGPCFDASLLATFVDGEVPVGVVNGSNATFALLSAPTPPSSLTLYRNGVRQSAVQDFTLSGSSIQFASASIPQSGDLLTASYRVGGTGGTPSQQINTVAPLAGGGSLATALTLSLTDAAFLRRGHRSMVIGDVQAGGILPGGTFPQSLPHWFNQLAVESRSTVQWAGNAGILANTTAAMLLRLPALLVTQAPDKMFIVAGYSDLNFQVPVPTIAANINQMVNTLKAANVLPILCTVPPQPADPAGIDTTITARVLLLNMQIRKVAAQQGVPLVDFYQLLVDPRTGQYKQGYSADGSRPQVPATRLMAERAMAATAGLFDVEYPYLPLVDSDGIDLLADPLFLQTPSKWTAATVSGVAMQRSIGSDPAIAGSTMLLTKTDTASVNTLTGTPVSTGFSPGDRVAFVGRIKSSSCEAGAMQFDVGLRFDPGAATSYPIYNWNVDIKDGQWYVEITVPAGATTMTPVVTLHSGTGSLTLGQIGVINLTQGGF